MKRLFTLVTTGLLVSALVACGGRNASVPSSGPALSGAVPTVSQPNAAPALAPDALDFPKAATGSVLNTATLNGSPGFVARNGHTVYVFDGDLQTPNASTCLGACPVSWSPIPAAGATLSGLWGQFTRMNGSMQLSYATRPLYQFIGDDAAGQTNGDGLVAFGGTWHIARPTTGVPSSLPTLTPTPPPVAGGAPTAAELLAKTQQCNQVSKGSYAGAGRVFICGAVGALWFKSDMDIDCDGQTLGPCPGPDPSYFDDTSCHQSDGKPLASAFLPYIVIPLPDAKFNYHKNNIQCGAIVAVIYRGQVEYAIFGDEGPTYRIGEASYATAVGLGIDPNPATGGAIAGVTYIVFPGSHAKPIEDHQSAIDQGEVLARQFINQN